ncbi:hypothetical protein [Listeria booriae]|uniref:Lactococcin 972 family bacteriocin n=1 Tax=Listeria booriae TaxID=1552123 RepID=A0A841XSH1_9LIST|nr:hypothetical protein [Listeria booriae]MBC1318122.1 hypothetical protein [Listeria booriae]
MKKKVIFIMFSTILIFSATPALSSNAQVLNSSSSFHSLSYRHQSDYLQGAGTWYQAVSAVCLRGSRVRAVANAGDGYTAQAYGEKNCWATAYSGKVGAPRFTGHVHNYFAR